MNCYLHPPHLNNEENKHALSKRYFLHLTHSCVWLLLKQICTLTWNMYWSEENHLLMPHFYKPWNTYWSEQKSCASWLFRHSVYQPKVILVLITITYIVSLHITICLSCCTTPLISFAHLLPHFGMLLPSSDRIL